MKKLNFYCNSLLFVIFVILFFQFFNVSFGEEKEYFVIKNPNQFTWTKTDQEFNAVLVEFLSGQSKAYIKFPSIKDNKYLLEKDGENLTKNFSEIIITEYTNYFWVESDGDVNVHLYNSKKNIKTLLAGTLKIGDLEIISRQEWGADETIRYDYRDEKEKNKKKEIPLTAKDEKCEKMIEKYPDEYTYDRVIAEENGQDLYWPRQYSKKIMKFVIHHTAEADTSWKIPGADKIRSIYYYHARTLGWGDIGYNFLIDQNGNIYEGRAGGDYVVGGHVYCSNINTIGISLMGNFMKNNTTKDQIESLAKLLKELSKKYDLDISTENIFHGEKKSVLLGHRDLGPSKCPGDNLYTLLPLLRKYFSVSQIDFSMSKKDDTDDTKEIIPESHYSAEISGKPTIIDLDPLSTKKITLSYLNTGEVYWKKGTWLFVDGNDNDNLWIDSIILDKIYVAADLKEFSVGPGEIGHFEFVVNSGITGGTYTLELTPIINSERKINSATILFASRIPETKFSYEFIEASSPENPFYYGQQKEAKVILKNTGNTAWNRSGKFAVTLSPLPNQKSKFTNPETPESFAWLNNIKVDPGQTGVFIFDINAGFDEGVFDIPFVPRVGDGLYLDDIGMKFTIQVKKPNYHAQILYDEGNVVFRPGETKYISLGLRNLGDVDWYENQISLRIVDRGLLKFQQNNYYFPDFVPKNGSSYINLAVTAPFKSGDYSAKLQALAYNKKFNKTRWLYLPINVEEAKLSGKITYLSKTNLKLKSKERAEIILRVKNTGNVTWENYGSNIIRLMIIKTRSLLKSDDWISNRIVAYMENDNVEPGDVATFRFSIKNNAFKKDFNEEFILKTKSLGDVDGTKFNLNIERNGDLIQNKIEKEDKSNSYIEKLKEYRLLKVKQINESEKNNLDENIRILLSFPNISANVTVSNDASLYIDNKFIKNINKNDSIWIRKDGNKIIVSFNGEKIFGDIIQIKNNTNNEKSYLILYNWNRSPEWNPNINDNTFEGILEFRLDGEKMIVINDLSFEAYLRGMAEIPEDEPNEKRKAMAVLARSYALHYIKTEYRKFQGKQYDGSDSPDVFQKYLGYNYSLRSPKWQKALKETEGEVITYKGEILRTAYFTCSNGRTKTPTQVNWNNDYYKKVSEVYESVDDVFGKDMIKYNKGQCGHGVGLSGSGASYLAKQGNGYKEIIKYYYKNVEISKI